MRLTLDGQVFLQQLDVVLFGQQGGQSSHQQADLDRRAHVLHHVEASLVHLAQRHLEGTRKSTPSREHVYQQVCGPAGLYLPDLLQLVQDPLLWTQRVPQDWKRTRRCKFAN